MDNAYGDIIDMQRPVHDGDVFSRRHPKMPRLNRAKLFAPYDALKPFESTVHAKDTVYVRRKELSEFAQECLDQRLRRLERGDVVTVTWFQATETDRDSGQSTTATCSAAAIRRCRV